MVTGKEEVFGNVLWLVAISVCCLAGSCGCRMVDRKRNGEKGSVAGRRDGEWSDEEFGLYGVLWLWCAFE